MVSMRNITIYLVYLAKDDKINIKVVVYRAVTLRADIDLEISRHSVGSMTVLLLVITIVTGSFNGKRRINITYGNIKVGHNCGCM